MSSVTLWLGSDADPGGQTVTVLGLASAFLLRCVFTTAFPGEFRLIFLGLGSALMGVVLPLVAGCAVPGGPFVTVLGFFSGLFIR